MGTLIVTCGPLAGVVLASVGSETLRCWAALAIRRALTHLMGQRDMVWGRPCLWPRAEDIGLRAPS